MRQIIPILDPRSLSIQLVGVNVAVGGQPGHFSGTVVTQSFNASYSDNNHNYYNPILFVKSHLCRRTTGPPLAVVLVLTFSFERPAL